MGKCYNISDPEKPEKCTSSITWTHPVMLVKGNTCMWLDAIPDFSSSICITEKIHHLLACSTY